MRRMFAIAAFFLVFIAPERFSAAQSPASNPRSYLGFDCNLYPGDDALSELRKTFSFSSYWLSPPPGEKENTWRGKRELFHSKGFGFLVLYRGRESKDLASDLEAKQKGISDGRSAISTAKREGFAARTIIFLDIEEGGRLPSRYHIYLNAWASQLYRSEYLPGVYCSAIPVKEAPGMSITTADDIRTAFRDRPLAFWVYNDACPPSPGCEPRENPPAPSSSGMPFAAVWQFAQSPRRQEFTSHCPANYQPDGNCYAPTDVAQKWVLDLNTALSPDPSDGAK